MKQKKTFHITKAMLKELGGDSSRERLLHRLHSVALVLNGISSVETGRIYGDSARAVSYWVTRFKQNGIEGLYEESRPGRPSRLSADQLIRLQTFMKKTTTLSKPLNAETVASYILKEFEIFLTHRQCWRILKKMKA